MQTDTILITRQCYDDFKRIEKAYEEIIKGNIFTITRREDPFSGARRTDSFISKDQALKDITDQVAKLQDELFHKNNKIDSLDSELMKIKYDHHIKSDDSDNPVPYDIGNMTTRAFWKIRRSLRK